MLDSIIGGGLLPAKFKYALLLVLFIGWIIIILLAWGVIGEKYAFAKGSKSAYWTGVSTGIMPFFMLGVGRL